MGVKIGPIVDLIRITPEPQDYRELELRLGKLSDTASPAEMAERYRLAQASSLIRLYRR
jgi:hypothetical protein